jgi:hypothetical protein
MGNSPSSLCVAVQGLTEGEAEDLSEESWAALMGSRERNPLTPADARRALSDAALREMRVTRPWNLAGVISRAVERLEELIEPDEGMEHLGAAVAPHDVASLLGALRILTRALPFVVGCPAAPPTEAVGDRASTAEAEVEKEDSATTAARAVHEHIWGAPSRVMRAAQIRTTARARKEQEPEPGPQLAVDGLEDSGGGEDDATGQRDKLLANALHWRRAESVGVGVGVADKETLLDARCSTAQRTAAAKVEDADDDDDALAGAPLPLLNLGERILALVLDLLFCPGFTLPFVDPTVGGREWGAAGTEAPELATHRTEVMRLVLALIASEVRCERVVHFAGGNASAPPPSSRLNLAIVSRSCCAVPFSSPPLYLRRVCVCTRL